MKMHKGSWVAVAIGAAAIITAISATAARERAAPMQDAAYLAAQQKALDDLLPAKGWQVLPGNVKWRRLKGKGTGVHPTVYNNVRIHYEGRLIDGKVFDSSWKRGEPIDFPLGDLIQGWQVALPMAGVGDTIEIAIPQEMGYGPSGAGEDIPGYATLFFKVELLGVQ
jgi:FKBP-type peptidyl-prolyl cis-trans isomerase FkpA